MTKTKSTKKSINKKPVIKDSLITSTTRKIDTTGAKVKARKLQPNSIQGCIQSVIDTCVHAYDIQKPKEKDIIIAKQVDATIHIIPIAIHCNWGKFLHKAQVELYLKHFASKLGYIEAGLTITDSGVQCSLIGPFEPSLLQESF